MYSVVAAGAGDAGFSDTLRGGGSPGTPCGWRGGGGGGGAGAGGSGAGAGSPNAGGAGTSGLSAEAALANRVDPKRSPSERRRCGRITGQRSEPCLYYARASRGFCLATGLGKASDDLDHSARGRKSSGNLEE